MRYVDTQDGCSYVADTVGKCDHQHSCGYHYKPSDYYRDNPWAVDSTSTSRATAAPPYTPPPARPFEPLPWHYVERSHSVRSVFWQWLSATAATRFAVSQQRLCQVFDDYLVGATRSGCVIFWQVDGQGLVHGGHIMQYRADGHRDGYMGWTHPRLIREGVLPKDWRLCQCLYGQHLLPRRPEARVCVVESEKTALLMALCFPEHLWVATGGCGGLSVERLRCLRGRRVTLFPDSGCYEKWSRQMKLTTGIDYSVSPRMESYPPNTDLADLMLREV